jgi:hypothetical protein
VCRENLKEKTMSSFSHSSQTSNTPGEVLLTHTVLENGAYSTTTVNMTASEARKLADELVAVADKAEEPKFKVEPAKLDVFQIGTGLLLRELATR